VAEEPQVSIQVGRISLDEKVLRLSVDTRLSTNQQCAFIANETKLIMGHIARTEASRPREVIILLCWIKHETALEIFISLGSPVLKGCVETGEGPAEGYEGQGPRPLAFGRDAEEVYLV